MRINPATLTLLCALSACGTGEPTPDTPEPLTLYSGRTEALIAPVIEAFEQATGTPVRVKYADSAQLAATIQAEGARSPADLFLAQDASTLAWLEQQDALAPLPDALVASVDPRFTSASGAWVGVSGRARVVAYSSDRVPVEELPTSVHDLTDPRWKGRVGWAPENASFQSFVAAMIQLEGREATEKWLEAMKANAPRDYPKNAPAVLAVERGEVDLALVNHYYAERIREERGGTFDVQNHYLPSGDAGAMLNLSGVAVLKTADQPEAAHALIRYLLSAPAQTHFATANHEFPLAKGAPQPEGLPAIDALRAPEVDLAELRNLEETVGLLRATGVLR